MKTAYIAIFAALCLVLAGTAASSQTDSGKTTTHATGSFEVKIDPQPADERSGAPTIGRMLIDKHFHGDLEASSKGTMLATGTGAKGTSGGYVAMEVVTGTLKGRTGSFVLQHTGSMTRGNPTTHRHNRSRLRHRATYRDRRNDVYQYRRWKALL